MYITINYKFGGKPYDYEISLSYTIIKDYYKHLVGEYTYERYSREVKTGFERCFDLVFQEEVFTADHFANNWDFMEWLKDRERNNALKEWQDSLKGE